jgi:hypothetical protein
VNDTLVRPLVDDAVQKVLRELEENLESMSSFKTDIESVGRTGKVLIGSFRELLETVEAHLGDLSKRTEQSAAELFVQCENAREELLKTTERVDRGLTRAGENLHHELEDARTTLVAAGSRLADLESTTRKAAETFVSIDVRTRLLELRDDAKSLTNAIERQELNSISRHRDVERSIERIEEKIISSLRDRIDASTNLHRSEFEKSINKLRIQTRWLTAITLIGLGNLVVLTLLLSR